MKVASGPGIEFLEYLSPRDGRPMPGDEKPNDLIHWQTRLVVEDLVNLEEKLRKEKYLFVSPGIVQLPEHELGFKRRLLVRDPDGHVIELVEK